METTGAVEVITMSSEPVRTLCVPVRSLPSAPSQKGWIFILPPLFSSVQAPIFARPLPIGCSLLTPLETRKLRSLNWACAAPAVRPAARATASKRERRE
jgi:hypothetical protein